MQYEAFDPRAQTLTRVPDPGDVDLVFLGVETAEDAVRSIDLLRKQGYRGAILGGDGYDAPAVWAARPDLSDIAFTTHVYLGADAPRPEVRQFIARYTAKFGDAPTAFSALAYDAVGLLAAAMKTIDAPFEPRDIAGGLSQIRDFPGVTGMIGYESGSRIPSKSVTILRVNQGIQSFVAEVRPEAVPEP